MITDNGQSNSTAVRDAHGRFLPGNKCSTGRRPVAVERRYLEITQANCTEADWAPIVQRAVADAKRGDHRAREWLSRYLIGGKSTEDAAHTDTPGRVVVVLPDNGRGDRIV